MGDSLLAVEDVTRGKVTAAPLVHLVDDNPDFREEMVFGLSGLGMNVLGFHGAADLYRAYAARPSDMVILGIGLEDEDGLSIAVHLQASQSAGIAIAKARSSVDDRVDGLKNGADAYLVKPIDVRELAATVVALNERPNRRRAPSPPPMPRGAPVEGGWVLADGTGNRLRLTTSEKCFLERLLRERGETVGSRALVEAPGADVYDFDDTHLHTIASRLRRRAEKSNMLLPLRAIRRLGVAFSD